jgi:DNA polymerase sigma
MAWSFNKGKSFADMVKTNLNEAPPRISASKALPVSPKQPTKIKEVKSARKKKTKPNSVPFSDFAASFPPAPTKTDQRTEGHSSKTNLTTETPQPPSINTTSSTTSTSATSATSATTTTTTTTTTSITTATTTARTPSITTGSKVTSPKTSRINAWHKPLKLETSDIASTGSSNAPRSNKSDGSTSPMITSRPTYVDASHQADFTELEEKEMEENKYIDQNGRTTHMSTETHRSMGTGTDDRVKDRREQGTSTEYPWVSPAVSQRDQSTTTEESREDSNNKDNPWRRMVMAATSAARERERIERGGSLPTQNQGTGASDYESLQQSRHQHHQQYYRSQHSQDYSVIKDTCQELTTELRSFGAYVSAVDLQCRPTIQSYVQYLNDTIMQACPDAKAIPYGSYATGLWLPTSDVDIVVQGAGSNQFKKRTTKQKKKKNKKKMKETEGEGVDVEVEEEEEDDDETEDDKTPEELLATAWEAFQRIYTLLSCQPWAENVKAITTSKMPVIKLTMCDGYNQIPFDVTIDPILPRSMNKANKKKSEEATSTIDDTNTSDAKTTTTTTDDANESKTQELAMHSGLPVLQLVKYCLSKMKGLATLTLVIKQFLRERGLNDTFRGGASSYTIFLMLVKFLQPHYPPLFEGEDFERLATKQVWAQMILNGKRAMRGGVGNNGNDLKTTNKNVSEKKSRDFSSNDNQNDIAENQGSNMKSSATSAPIQPNAPSFTASTRWRRLTNKLMRPLARTHEQLHREIGAMLMEFLYYYGDIFDYSRDGFSIIGEEGQCFNVQEERRGGDPMWIDDPMRPGFNVASTTFQIQQIASAFRDGFLSLGRHSDDKDHPTRLSRLIKDSPWIEKFHLDAGAREQERIKQLQMQKFHRAHEAVVCALPAYTGNNRLLSQSSRKALRKKKLKSENARKKNRKLLKKKEQKGGKNGGGGGGGGGVVVVVAGVTKLLAEARKLILKHLKEERKKWLLQPKRIIHKKTASCN